MQLNKANDALNSTKPWLQKKSKANDALNSTKPWLQKKSWKILRSLAIRVKWI